MIVFDAPVRSTFDRIEWLEKRQYIGRRAVWAAGLLVDDCQLSQSEAISHRPMDGGCGSGHRGSAQQFRINDAKERIERVSNALGSKLTEILTLVVLRNMGLTDAAKVMNIHEKAALPLVQAGLEVLAGHYANTGRT